MQPPGRFFCAFVLCAAACLPPAEEATAKPDAAAAAAFDAATAGAADLDLDLADAGAAGPRCSAEMALVFYALPEGDTATVCIDRYEAGLVKLLPDGREEPWPFDRPADGVAVRAVVAAGRKPQAYISGSQASAACKAAGKRLCTEAEWLAACQGPRGYTYPYGNTYEKGACNEGRATNPVNDCFGAGSSVFTYANMNDPCCVGKPNTLAPSGAFGKCRSDFDVYDLHGNLHEWIDGTTSRGTGIFKGGFFVDAKINGAGCLYRTTAHAKTYHDYSTGFRCCSSPL